MAELLIIGQGPAGISSALYALRAGHSVTIVAKDSGALSKAHAIENYYGLKAPVSGKELANIGKEQALKLGAKIINDEITDLFFDGENFIASSAENKYQGKACILATGSARKKNPFENLQNLEGKGVSYCAVCDAFFFRKKHVAVLGNSEYALHEAEELLQVASSVTLLLNGEPCLVKCPESLKIADKKITALLGEEKFSGIQYADNSIENFDGLFIAIGTASATDLAKKTGAAFENGKLILDNSMQTTVPGLFAAGDCTGGVLQVAVAVGEGAKAALSAIQYLRKSERN